MPVGIKQPPRRLLAWCIGELGLAQLTGTISSITADSLMITAYVHRLVIPRQHPATVPPLTSANWIQRNPVSLVPGWCAVFGGQGDAQFRARPVHLERDEPEPGSPGPRSAERTHQARAVAAWDYRSITTIPTALTISLSPRTGPPAPVLHAGSGSGGRGAGSPAQALT